jgi:hypothetical protein
MDGSPDYHALPAAGDAMVRVVDVALAIIVLLLVFFRVRKIRAREKQEVREVEEAGCQKPDLVVWQTPAELYEARSRSLVLRNAALEASVRTQQPFDPTRFRKKAEGLVWVECGWSIRFWADNCVGWTLKELLEWLQVYFPVRQAWYGGPFVHWLPEELVKVEVNELPAEYDCLIKNGDRIVFDPKARLTGSDSSQKALPPG